MKYLFLVFALALAIYQYCLGINIEIDKNKKIEAINSISYLKISSINLHENIYLGYSESLLYRGLLMEPEGLKSNNIVIYGHRFSVKHPFRKYLIDLDKVRIGDLVIASIKNINYEYEITNILEVLPQETWVLSDTLDQRLTIITCTPAYNPQNRLVIISKLVRKY